MGFNNISEYANADDAGRTWISSFRKLPSSTATVTSSYFDYSYSSGFPLANFYASTPLESAYVDITRGLRVPNEPNQYLKNITVCTATASESSTTSERQVVTLCDYLMYYPFIDTDSTDTQEMIQTLTLPRYSHAKVFAVAQSASSSVGQFTFSYTNQDGVSGRTSPNIFTQIVAGGGQSLLASVSGNGFDFFLPLQTGDYGVKSIDSVTFTALGGGLMCLVLLVPLQTVLLESGSRRTTTGDLQSYGAPSSFDSILNNARVPKIEQGAVLNLISKGCGGSLASSVLVGFLETIWS